MKKFILKSILFISIISIILGVSYWHWFSEAKTAIKIPRHNIIIGDSNTRWSIDDKILKNYSNYSTGGELYIFAYRKLKILNEQNKIDTLMLSFSPHNIINNKWWNDKEGTPLKNRMGAFYKDFSKEEHLDFIKHVPRTYLNSLSKVGENKISSMFAPKDNSKYNDMFRFGSYIPTMKNETQIPFEYYEYKEPVITNIETKYLNKIIEECEKSNIHLILIQPPKNYLRKDFKNYMHPQFYEYYNENYSNIDFLDFSMLKLPKHAYCDIMHVDIIGAEFFSNFLAKHKIKDLLSDPKFNKKINP